MLFNRSRGLLKDNRERWEPACVACGGSKKGNPDDFPAMGMVFDGGEARIPCPACKGTGRQPCRWERGFPVVEVSALRQAWEGDGPPLSPYRPTPWLCDLLRTHHIAGVWFTIPFPLNAATVPPQVMRHIIDNNIGRAVVLAALEWLDAQGAA